MFELIRIRQKNISIKITNVSINNINKDINTKISIKKHNTNKYNRNNTIFNQPQQNQ